MESEKFTVNFFADDRYRTIKFKSLSKLANFLCAVIDGVKPIKNRDSKEQRYVVWTGQVKGAHPYIAKNITAEVTGEREFIDYCLARHKSIFFKMSKPRLIINGATENLFGTKGSAMWNGRFGHVPLISAYKLDKAQGAHDGKLHSRNCRL